MDLNHWMNSARTWLLGMADEWTAYQTAVVVVCLALAFVVSRWLSLRVEERLRLIKGHPKVLRVLVVVLRHLYGIVVAIFLWISVGVLDWATTPTHLRFVFIIAKLASAWTAVSILSRLIRNRSWARIVERALWVVAALIIVGWLEDVRRILDWVGVTIGDRRLSLLTLLEGLAVLAVVLWATSLAAATLEVKLRSSDFLRPSVQVLALKFFKAGMIVAGASIALATVGFDPTAITVFSGAFGLGLAFSLQKVSSNLLSGVIILLDQSIKPGDVIQLGETFGWINALRARYVSVATRDGAEYLIPNETFVTERVVSWSYSDRRVRQEIHFGVAYDCDPHEVRRLTTAAVARIDRVMTSPAPVCHLIGFGESSLNFSLRFWIEDPEKGVMNVKGQVNLAVWDVLRQNNMGIPYPRREVVLHTNS